MSIAGDIVEEYYENDIIPPLKKKIKILEASILEFYQVLKDTELGESYKTHFNLTNERL